MAVTPINTGDGSVIGGLEDLAIKYLKEQAVEALVAKFTGWAASVGLGGPVEAALGFFISPVAGFFIGLILSFLLSQTILRLAIVYLSIEVQYDVKSAEDVARKLKAVLDNPQAYTDAQAKDVEANFDAETVELIRIGMSLVT